MTTQHYNAYKAAGETVVGANQIPALYEGCIKFMYQAKEAIEQKNYELRFNLVNKVIGIITGLRECLNLEEAQDVSKVLDDYYAMIDFQLLTLQSNDDSDLCDQIIASLKQMHGAWKDVAAEYNKNSDISGDADVSLSENAQSSINGEPSKQELSDALDAALLAAQEVDSNEEGDAPKKSSISASASAAYTPNGGYSANGSASYQQASDASEKRADDSFETGIESEIYSDKNAENSAQRSIGDFEV